MRPDAADIKNVLKRTTLFVRDRHDAPYLLVVLGVLILVPAAVSISLLPSPQWAMAGIVINTIGIAMASATGAVSVLAFSDYGWRAYRRELAQVAA